MMATHNFEDPRIIWHDIQPDFLRNLTPGRYILRKKSVTDTRFYAVLTAVQENSTGRGLQLFVNDLREFFFLDGPPTWESMRILRDKPQVVHLGKQVCRNLQFECLIHNVHLLSTVQMGKGNMKGNWRLEEKEVIKQMEIISAVVLQEYDCFFVDKIGDVREELMSYFLVLDNVPNPNKGENPGKAVSKTVRRMHMLKRKAAEKKDAIDGKKRKTD